MTVKSVEKSKDTSIGSIEGKTLSTDKTFYQYVVAFSGEIYDSEFIVCGIYGQ